VERVKQLVVLGRELKVEKSGGEGRVQAETSAGKVPGWVRKLISYLCERGELCHHARVAVVRSLLAAGWAVEEVVDLFRKCAKDFDERRTRYHVEYEKRRLDRGERPWRCATVVQHCGGGELPENLCRS
jgi:DNA primase large subunit